MAYFALEMQGAETTEMQRHKNAVLIREAKQLQECVLKEL